MKVIQTITVFNMDKLLCARHCAKCFIRIISFNPPNSVMR